jgi:hypothetical protein
MRNETVDSSSRRRTYLSTGITLQWDFFFVFSDGLILKPSVLGVVSLFRASWPGSYKYLSLWGVRVPAWARNFSLHHHVQTGSGAHPASYRMDTRGSFPGGKATSYLHLVPRSRMRGSIPPLSQYAFTAWWSVKAQGSYMVFGLKYEIIDTVDGWMDGWMDGWKK